MFTQVTKYQVGAVPLSIPHCCLFKTIVCRLKTKDKINAYTDKENAKSMLPKWYLMRTKTFFVSCPTPLLHALIPFHSHLIVNLASSHRETFAYRSSHFFQNGTCHNPFLPPRSIPIPTLLVPTPAIPTMRRWHTLSHRQSWCYRPRSRTLHPLSSINPIVRTGRSTRSSGTANRSRPRPGRR